MLARAGATHVLVFEGTNDISGGFTAAEVIAGMQEVVRRVHEAGLKIVGATVIPRGRSGPGWTGDAGAAPPIDLSLFENVGDWSNGR